MTPSTDTQSFPQTSTGSSSFSSKEAYFTSATPVHVPSNSHFSANPAKLHNSVCNNISESYFVAIIHADRTAVPAPKFLIDLCVDFTDNIVL
ncbi:uncharacterized protein ColSpa_12096 [Colletotrichum spaethianum]|uniref:Uncharacterized protein n=1 Tax=Colletotrichum spaethianum TaxID=700344 RepID=A0AA37UQ73_9PEZI|nr:uncharacterized protein ColSpa_12096 [Colletotrichum spaethianum]GKT51915.1 hypothetical protein ColSpa_12096 [Colletotrichum spaethianum]